MSYYSPLFVEPPTGSKRERKSTYDHDEILKDLIE